MKSQANVETNLRMQSKFETINKEKLLISDVNYEGVYDR